MQTRKWQLTLFKLYSVIEYFLLMNMIGFLVTSVLKLPAERFDWLRYLQLSTILQSLFACTGLVLSIANIFILSGVRYHKKKILRFSLLVVSVLCYTVLLLYSLLESAFALGS